MNAYRGNRLLQYAHRRNNQLFPNVLEDFRDVVKRAPEETVAQGIAAAIRSENTGSLAQMVADLFFHSDAPQRVELLNIVVAPLGENAQRALSNAGLFGLDPESRCVTADTTMQLSSQAIGAIAAEAEQRDSGVIDRISAFYAPYSDVVSKLDTQAVLTILTDIADRASRDAGLLLSIQRDYVQNV